MKVLGITGGVGSGKSLVLEYLKNEYGAVICQLDEVAKDLQKKGQPCYEQIVKVFGREVVSTVDGELDRSRLAQIVFRDETKLMRLNRIVHPEVKRQVQKLIAEETKRISTVSAEQVKCQQENISGGGRKETALFVIEAALLPTAGYEDICDEMWYIYAEESIRRERLKASRGYTDEKITDMIQSQPAEHVFRRACTAVIDNSGTFEETKKQIGELLV